MDTFQSQGYSTKVTGQICLKILCCTTLCRSELLYALLWVGVGGIEENISGDNQNRNGTNNKSTDFYVTNIVYSGKSVCYCDDNQ